LTRCTEAVAVRLQPHELEHIADCAAQLDVSVSDFIRAMLDLPPEALAGPPPRPPRQLWAVKPFVEQATAARAATAPGSAQRSRAAALPHGYPRRDK
jgi:hypothetical protein